MDDRLRLLAHWHARRREVDELLEPLLAHGPAAVERVTARLLELGEAMDAERCAFEAFAAVEQPGPAAGALPGAPLGALPGTQPGAQPGAVACAPTGPVDEVAAARAARHRPPPSTAVRPSVAEVVARLDADPPPPPLHVL